jgi:hypothetical protein
MLLGGFSGRDTLVGEGGVQSNPVFESEPMFRNDVFKIFGDSLAVARAISRESGIRRGVWYFISFRTRGFLRFLFDCLSASYSRLSGKPLIHVIGDSHGKVYRWNLLFIVYHLGAATAHNLAKESSTTGSNRKLFNIIDRIGRRDIVVLVFGEIDCRIHIYYQYKKNGETKTLAELIDDTISCYGTVLEKLRDRGMNFAVQGVPPATRVRNEYRYPFYATPEIHCQISAMFNERLEAACEKNGYPYIDVYSRSADEDGFMLQEYAADEIHLNRRIVAFVRGDLREKLGVRV